jgi:hypothetical protein
MIAAPAAAPCGVCSRPVDAFQELADDIVRTVHDQVPSLWSLPRRGAAAERRASFLAHLLTTLLCGAPDQPRGHQRREPTEPLAAVHAGFDRVVAAGSADLTTVLRLLHQVEVLLNRWLWDTRWPMPVTGLSSGTRRIAAVGRELRTALVLSQCRRAARDMTWAGLLLGQVLMVDEEAARGAADELGLTLDLDTTWCVLVGEPQQAGWLHGVPAAGLVLESRDDSGWLLAADTARSVLPELHEKLVAAGEALVVVGPVPAKALCAGIAHATEVARLARAAGLHGVVRDTDVLLEATVARVPKALAGLAGLLEHLDGQGPELRVTLEQFYANDLNKTRTATMLGIHRSTLEYRLARVQWLTGLHPDSTRGIQVLATALAATRLLETHPGRSAERPRQTRASGIDTAARAVSDELAVVAGLRRAHPVHYRRGTVQASGRGSLVS